MTKGIYNFYWDCGRMGDVESTFIATAEDVAKIIGKEIYFGEILGKHSEIYGVIKEGNITLQTDDQKFIQQFEEILGEGWSTGHNPFEHLPDDWDEDEFTGMDDDEVDQETFGEYV